MSDQTRGARTRGLLTAALLTGVLSAAFTGAAAAAPVKDPGSAPQPTSQPAPAPPTSAPDPSGTQTAGEGSSALDAATAELLATQMQLRAARTELKTTRDQIAANTAALTAARAASDAARTAEATATIELTTAGYKTQASRYALENLVRDTYLKSTANSMPDWAWVISGQSDALHNAATVQQAEANATNATTDQYLVHSEDSKLSERIAAQTSAARQARQAAEAEVSQRLSEAVALEAKVAAVTDQAAALAKVQRAKVTEARKLIAADSARMDALQAAADRLTKRLDARVAKLPPNLQKVLTGAVGGLAYPGLGVITSPFGMRYHPILHYVKLHTGTDFSVSDGYAYAAADGVVLSSAPNVAYGNLVTIGHGTVNGQRLDTWYAHLSVAYVHAGEVVHKGQVIGHIGATGYATGPHLHFEVRINEQPVDPMTYLVNAVRPTPAGPAFVPPAG